MKHTLSPRREGLRLHTSGCPAMLRRVLALVLCGWLAVLLVGGPVQDVTSGASSAIASVAGWREPYLTGSAAPSRGRRTAAEQQASGHLSYEYAVVHYDDSHASTASSYGHSLSSGSEDVAPVVEALLAMQSLPEGQACLPPLDKDWLSLLGKAELRVFSQNKEDGALLGILLNIGFSARRYIEFGTEDGSQCNTRVLRDRLGWAGLLMDGSHARPEINLHRELITPQNINQLLSKYLMQGGGGAAQQGSDPSTMIDVMSIDLDYSDWWVWRALNESLFRPRVVLVEYNAGIPPNVSATVDPEDSARWTGSNYFGASLKALADLAQRKGYSLVYADSQGVNSFYVRNDILQCQGVQAPSVEQVWRPPRYSGGVGHPQDLNTSRQWLFLDGAGEVVERKYVDHWR